MKTLPRYCRSFRSEARKVWKDMTEAEEFALPRNEETITEELLLSLARNHKGRGLEIKAYSKKKEIETGADWAFWFTDSTWLGIGARIQAKRLFADGFRYKSLYHQSDAQKKKSKSLGLLTPNQCETLLTYRDGLVPIYVFYNSDSLLTSAVLGHIDMDWSKCSCAVRSVFSDWGISAASALAIKNANWGKDNYPGDFPMVPWHCLVCACYRDDRPAVHSIPSLVGHGLRQLYRYSTAEGGEDTAEYADLGFTFEPTRHAPSWVGLLREGREAEEELDEEMSRLNLKGVAIIEETELIDE